MPVDFGINGMNALLDVRDGVHTCMLMGIHHRCHTKLPMSGVVDILTPLGPQTNALLMMPPASSGQIPVVQKQASVHLVQYPHHNAATWGEAMPLQAWADTLADNRGTSIDLIQRVKCVRRDVMAPDGGLQGCCC